MKRSFVFIMAMAVMASRSVSACDMCGCSASSQYLGLLPQYNWNFVGIQHQFSDFTSLHASVYEGRPDVHAYDAYNTMQVWGRYNIAPKYQLFAFVPYHYNVHREDSANATSSGVGDISLLLNRVFINERGKKWKHSLQGGAGIKLPTGKYTGISTLDKEGLPDAQPGTGSWDIITNANYTVRHNKVGANIDASYTFTTANSDNYKYGNRMAMGAVAFYALQAKKISIMPQAGIRYEYTLHDYDNYEKRWLNDQSGGYLCYAMVGVQAYYKHIGMRCTYQLPVSQHYGAGCVTAKQKLETGVFFLF